MARRNDADRDGGKLESDESWKEFLRDQPIVPKELENYNHLKIDNSTGPLENCVRMALNYIASPGRVYRR